MQALKVATVVPKYGLMGGAEGFVFELTERIAARKEFQVHVFANKWRPGKAPVVFHKVPVIAFPKWMQPVSFAWFAGNRIRSGGFDIIHAHERLFEMDIFSFHGIPHMTWRRIVRRKPPGLFDLATAWVEKRGIINERLKKIMPVSSLVVAELAKFYDIPDVKIHISHPGVSLERFDRYDRRACRKQIRGKHGFTNEDIVVLFVGMNFEIKGLDLVIEAFSRLTERILNSRFRLMIVGRGDQRKYAFMAQRAGIAGQVVFAGPTREAEKYFLASDVFIMPSVYDTFGLVVLEAMAAGLPVIISENVGAKDIVVPHVHGYIVPEKPRPSDVAVALASLSEEDKRKQMGKNCRKLAEQCSWDGLADNLAELYREIGRTSNI